MYIRGLGNFFNELFLPEASVHWNCLQNRVKLDKSLNSACACIRKDLKLSETSHLYSLNNAVSVSWVFFFKDKHWNWNKIFKNYQQEIFQWNHVVGFLEWWWKMDFSSWFKTGQEFKFKKKKSLWGSKAISSLFSIYAQLLLSGRLDTCATPLAEQQSCAEELLKFLRILGEV